MPLIVAAIVPHTPLLIPAVGREHTAALQATTAAYELLAMELAQARVETIMIIGDHGALRPDVFTLNQAPQLRTDLRDFGDIVTAQTWKPNVRLANTLRHYAETNLPLVSVAEAQLSYIVGVPLLLLSRYLPTLTVCPLGTCFLPAADHLAIGSVINHLLVQDTTRVALIVANDLAAVDAPPGFDELVRQVVREQDWDRLAAEGAAWADHQPGLTWRNLLVLGGVLRNGQTKGEILSYQSPFGVGLLMAAFRPA